MHICLTYKRQTCAAVVEIVMVPGYIILFYAVAVAVERGFMAVIEAVAAYRDILRPYNIGRAVAVTLILFICKVIFVFALVKGTVMQPDIPALSLFLVAYKAARILGIERKMQISDLYTAASFKGEAPFFNRGIGADTLHGNI